MGLMTQLLTRIALTALALWATTAVVPGIQVIPFSGSEPLSSIVSMLFVALIIAIVNAALGPILKVLSLPLYIVTLGLWSFVLNALLLWLAAQISSLFGWGLVIDHFWWSAVLGAIVLGFANWALSVLTRRLTA